MNVSIPLFPSVVMFCRLFLFFFLSIYSIFLFFSPYGYFIRALSLRVGLRIWMFTIRIGAINLHAYKIQIMTPSVNCTSEKYSISSGFVHKYTPVVPFRKWMQCNGSHRFISTRPSRNYFLECFSFLYSLLCLLLCARDTTVKKKSSEFIRIQFEPF